MVSGCVIIKSSHSIVPIMFRIVVKKSWDANLETRQHENGQTQHKQKIMRYQATLDCA